MEGVDVHITVECGVECKSPSSSVLTTFWKVSLFRGRSVHVLRTDRIGDAECESSIYRRKFRSETSDNMDRWKSTARKKLSHGESQT